MHNISLDVIPMFILGATLLAFIYHLVLLFYNRDKFMIHYLVYLFFTGVFMYSKTNLYAAAYGQVAELYMMFYLKKPSRLSTSLPISILS